MVRNEHYNYSYEYVHHGYKIIIFCINVINIGINISIIICALTLHTWYPQNYVEKRERKCLISIAPTPFVRIILTCIHPNMSSRNLISVIDFICIYVCMYIYIYTTKSQLVYIRHIFDANSKFISDVNFCAFLLNNVYNIHQIHEIQTWIHNFFH